MKNVNLSCLNHLVVQLKKIKNHRLNLEYEPLIKLKGLGQGPFFFIIIFNLVLAKLQDAFYRF